ncbi:MAG: hypothetical protein RH916_04270 [Vicingaceae bacterium]
MKGRVLERILLWLTLFISLMTLLSVTLPPEDINQYTIKGKYDKELAVVDNVRELNSTVLKHWGDRPFTDSLAFAELIDSVLSLRFYHGTSRYNFHENYIAFFLGYLFWDDLRTIALPDEILKKNMAVCNQINIVFQEVLRTYNFQFRTVGWNNHLITEVRISGAWFVFDSDYEPVFEKRPSSESLLSDNVYFRSIYKKTPGDQFNDNFESIMSTKTAHYSTINQELAPNLKRFQRLSLFLSKKAWSVLILLFAITKYLNYVRNMRIS